MNTLKKVVIRMLLPAAILVLLGCAERPSVQSEFVLGTICTVNLYEKGNKKVYRAIFTRLKEIEDRMSANMEGTDVDKINKNAGIAPVVVHDDVLEVIEKAVSYAELTGGAFDPTVGPLVSLWGIGFDNPRLPGEDEIREALSLINWRDIEIDTAAKTVYLPMKGMKIDLGAIAKGYAADEAAKIIRSAKINRAIIDLGGNIMCIGSKSADTPWRVGIQNPSGMRGEYLGISEIVGKTLVTSGVYERFFEENGIRYHHLLSTKDGYPVNNGLVSVTVIADKSIDGDALSTSLFVLGFEKGYALAESRPGVDAFFVFEDFSIRGTPGALEHFTLSDGRYHIVK